MADFFEPYELRMIDRRKAIRTFGAGAVAAFAAAAMPRDSVAFIAQQAAGEAPRSRFESVNGVRLHVLEWGAAAARPLVLLHAAPLNAHAWDAFGSVMAPQFHVIAPDARGFGDSDWSKIDDDDTFVADLHALVVALGLKRLVLCGNSMGGSIAMAYASSHSEVMDRLILVDVGPGPKPGEPGPEVPPGGRSGPPPLPRGPFASREEVVVQVTKTAGPRYAGYVTHENLIKDANGTWRWKYDVEGSEGGFERSIRDPRRWPRWLAIKCPTLVLRGSRSPALSQQAAEEMVRENPNATLKAIPDAGHFIALDQPIAFEKAVRSWLGV